MTFSGLTSFTDMQKEKIVLKLNCLKFKFIGYESHKDFLCHCLADKLVPKGSRLELEPTTENCEQEFIDRWYAKLKSFSLTLIKDNYCANQTKYQRN